jgi:hypothetical protein
MNKRLLAFVSLLVVASMTLAACGGGRPQWRRSRPGGYECTDALGCVTIAPGEPVQHCFWGVLSGADSSLGEDSKRGVEIAIDDMGGIRWDTTSN